MRAEHTNTFECAFIGFRVLSSQLQCCCMQPHISAYALFMALPPTTWQHPLDLKGYHVKTCAAACFNWTLLNFTGISCPANSNYTSCASACPASCSDFTSPSECESPCVEGCECLPGYILSDSECVPYKECGCTYLDKYYEVQSPRGSHTSHSTSCSSFCQSPRSPQHIILH